MHEREVFESMEAVRQPMFSLGDLESMSISDLKAMGGIGSCREIECLRC